MTQKGCTVMNCDTRTLSFSFLFFSIFFSIFRMDLHNQRKSHGRSHDHYGK